MSRGGDRGEHPQTGPDGWAVAGGGSGPPRPPPKAGDLSNFGKISKPQPMTFGPSSIFAGKKGAESKREAISRTNSSSNMFSMLSSQAPESGDAAAKGMHRSKAICFNLLTSVTAAEPMQRKRLVLQPRSRPVEADTPEPTESSPLADSDGATSEEDTPSEMTEARSVRT
jgi:translation initiation factor 4G